MVNEFSEISAESEMAQFIALSPAETKEANDWFDQVDAAFEARFEGFEG
jgi:hypothetical protein